MYRIRYTFLGCVEVFGWWTAGRADPSTRPFSNGLRRRKTVETLKGNHRLHASSPSSLFTELEAPPTEFLNSFSASYPNLESYDSYPSCGRRPAAGCCSACWPVSSERFTRRVFQPYLNRFSREFSSSVEFFSEQSSSFLSQPPLHSRTPLFWAHFTTDTSPPSTNLHQQLALQ
jgi:hypothetical protein